MTFKQGEKLTLSSHLQVCGANLEFPQQLKRKAVGSWSKSRLQVVES